MSLASAFCQNNPVLVWQRTSYLSIVGNLFEVRSKSAVIMSRDEQKPHRPIKLATPLGLGVHVGL